MQIKCIQKDFEIKNLGEFHDLYLKSDSLLLADVSKNFRKICLKMQHLHSVKFLSVPELAEVQLELLIDTDMLLMVEKGIKGGICDIIYQYAKANNKQMKDYDKQKNHHILNIECK